MYAFQLCLDSNTLESDAEIVLEKFSRVEYFCGNRWRPWIADVTVTESGKRWQQELHDLQIDELIKWFQSWQSQDADFCDPPAPLLCCGQRGSCRLSYSHEVGGAGEGWQMIPAGPAEFWNVADAQAFVSHKLLNMPPLDNPSPRS